MEFNEAEESLKERGEVLLLGEWLLLEISFFQMTNEIMVTMDSQVLFSSLCFCESGIKLDG